jgi:hypothetical protein
MPSLAEHTTRALDIWGSLNATQRQRLVSPEGFVPWEVFREAAQRGYDIRQLTIALRRCAAIGAEPVFHVKHLRCGLCGVTVPEDKVALPDRCLSPVCPLQP